MKKTIPASCVLVLILFAIPLSSLAKTISDSPREVRKYLKLDCGPLVADIPEIGEVKIKQAFLYIPWPPVTAPEQLSRYIEIEDAEVTLELNGISFSGVCIRRIRIQMYVNSGVVHLDNTAQNTASIPKCKEAILKTRWLKIPLKKKVILLKNVVVVIKDGELQFLMPDASIRPALAPSRRSNYITTFGRIKSER